MKCLDSSVTAVFFIGSCLLSATGYFHPSTSHHHSSSRTYCTKLHSGSESTPVNPRSAGLNALGRALNIAAAGLAVGSASFLSTSNAADSTPKISLSPLPYSYTALAPFISEATLKTHHDKHHAKYVSTTLSMIKGTDLENADLVSVMKSAHVVAPVLFNNAAQSWNHDFYWKCMKSGGGGAPTGNIGALIDKNFGSYEAFKKQFATAGNTAFGSGWAWLVQSKDGKLEIMKTIGAENPIIDGKKPLLTMDVWEHAYYLDYQNNRSLYVDAFLDHLVDWPFVSSQMESA